MLDIQVATRMEDQMLTLLNMTTEGQNEILYFISTKDCVFRIRSNLGWRTHEIDSISTVSLRISVHLERRKWKTSATGASLTGSSGVDRVRTNAIQSDDQRNSRRNRYHATASTWTGRKIGNDCHQREWRNEASSAILLRFSVSATLW